MLTNSISPLGKEAISLARNSGPVIVRIVETSFSELKESDVSITAAGEEQVLSVGIVEGEKSTGRGIDSLGLNSNFKCENEIP